MLFLFQLRLLQNYVNLQIPLTIDRRICSRLKIVIANSICQIENQKNEWKCCVTKPAPLINKAKVLYNEANVFHCLSNSIEWSLKGNCNQQKLDRTLKKLYYCPSQFIVTDYSVPIQSPTMLSAIFDIYGSCQHVITWGLRNISIFKIESKIS